ncbi:PREDICTED: uncharacterized protein LOC102004898 [Chinchilla lanigera]|uniref:uncharacterized protein LOC102004898 n=1 Tax=Chinchilla lanigera TaxID=34839 RepID=UPI000698A03B|nr:PREDICTED: uncharacterized protein LOC102004898 [Chinchilla lanigera]
MTQKYLQSQSSIGEDALYAWNFSTPKTHHTLRISKSLQKLYHLLGIFYTFCNLKHHTLLKKKGICRGVRRRPVQVPPAHSSLRLPGAPCTPSPGAQTAARLLRRRLLGFPTVSSAIPGRAPRSRTAPRARPLSENAENPRPGWDAGYAVPHTGRGGPGICNAGRGYSRGGPWALGAGVRGLPGLELVLPDNVYHRRETAVAQQFAIGTQKKISVAKFNSRLGISYSEAHEAKCAASRLQSQLFSRLMRIDRKRKRKIEEIKDFLPKTRWKDAKSVKIKKNKDNMKFKVQCSRYLLTLVIADKEKAEKLKQSLPPALAVKELARTSQTDVNSRLRFLLWGRPLLA